MKIDIRQGEHVFVCGQTGSGKSVLLRTLIPAFPHRITFDYKREESDGVIVTGVGEFQKLFRQVPPAITYRPIGYETREKEEELDMVVNWALERRNTAIILHEAKMFPTSRMLAHAVSIGRSIGCTCILASQRPKLIRNEVISESTHFFVFYLQLAPDRQKLTECLGVDFDQVLNTPKHHFWYFKPGMSEPVLCSPV